MNLFKLAIELFGDTRPLESDMANAATIGQKGGARAGDAFKQGFGSRAAGPELMQKLSGALEGGALVSLAVKGAQLATAAGAETMGLRRQLEGVYQDTGKAQKALEELQGLSATSGYGAGVMNLGLKIAGRYSSVEELGAAVRKQLDAAAAMGVSPEKFNDYQVNIEQLQTRGTSKADMQDVRQLLNAAPTAISRIAQTMGVSYAEAQKRIMNTMSGNDLLKALEKVGEQNVGSAEKLSMTTLAGATFAAGKAFEQSLSSTGELLNNFGAPIMAQGRNLANAFGTLNKMTGGAAGLVGGFAILGAGIFLTVKAYDASFGALLRFTGALEAATVALGVNKVGGAIGAGIGNAAGSALGSAGIGGLMARVAPFIEAALPIALGLAAVAMVAYGAYKFNDAMHGKTDDNFKKFVESGGITGSGKRAEEVQKEQARAVEENTKALREVAAKMVGGGGRANAAASALEVEFAMAAYTRGIA